MIEKQARQGDVLLNPINEFPRGLTALNTGVRGADGAHLTSGGDVILAHGEVTGHAHRIETACPVKESELPKNAKCEAYFRTTPGGDIELFLDVKEKCELTHEEHGTIDVKPGKYSVVRQREGFDSMRQSFVMD